MRRFLPLFLLACTVLAPVAAEPLDMIEGPVTAQIIRVRDGDTVEAEVFIWPMQSVHIAVRLRGIDAPELRGGCEAEKDAAAMARNRLAGLVGSAFVRLTKVEGDKYFGRVLAELSPEAGEDVARTLLSEGLVAPYEGGRRRDWCDPA